MKRIFIPEGDNLIISIPLDRVDFRDYRKIYAISVTEEKYIYFVSRCNELFCLVNDNGGKTKYYESVAKLITYEFLNYTFYTTD